MKVTVTVYLNVRIGKPSLNAPCYQYLAPCSRLEVDGKFYKGDPYDGNDNWMKDAEENYYWAGGLDVTNQPAATNPIQPAVVAPAVTHLPVSSGNTTNITNTTNTAGTVTTTTTAPSTATPLATDIVPPIALTTDAAVNYNTLIPGIPEDVRNTMGAGVTIAVIDTGCAAIYSDLQDRIIDRYDAYDRTSDANDISVNSHGTFIAGLLCANSGALRGVAPAAKLIVVKVLRSLSVDNASAVNAGLVWLKNHHKDVDIVSMSMNFDPENVENLLKITYSQFSGNTMLIASAGDNGTLLSELSCYPANYTAFTGVGSMSAQLVPGNMDKLNSTARYVLPDIAYTSYSKSGASTSDKGSSFSTAITAGIMALLIADYKAKKIPYDRHRLLQDLDRLSGNLEGDDFKNNILKPYIKQAPIV